MGPQMTKPEIYIPFSAATHAVGISQKRVRNWLDRNLIHLDADEERTGETKHRRFSELDVMRLGVIARLTVYGFSAERASEIVEELLDKLRDVSEFPAKLQLSREDKILGSLSTVSMTIWWNEDDETDQWVAFDNRKPEPKSSRKHDARLILNIGQMVEAMYDRLEAAGLRDDDSE